MQKELVAVNHLNPEYVQWIRVALNHVVGTVLSVTDATFDKAMVRAIKRFDSKGTQRSIVAGSSASTAGWARRRRQHL